jgi:hypothetical protein
VHRATTTPVPPGGSRRRYHSSPSGRPWPSATSCFRCFKRFKVMFQVLHLNVAKVNLRCCICCNGNICMLQAYVLIVSCVSNVLFQMFYLNVSKLI